MSADTLKLLNIIAYELRAVRTVLWFIGTRNALGSDNPELQETAKQAAFDANDALHDAEASWDG